MTSRLPIALALLGTVACGDDTAATVDTGTTSSGSSTTSGSSSTAVLDGSDSGSESSESTTGPMPCVDNGDCGGGTPFCEPVSGECVTCDGTEDPDGSCAGVDPANPVCLDGACVQCTAAAPEACMGMTPVCDDATNTCVPCTAHDQCMGEAGCNLFTGACLPSDAVVHVGPGQMHGTLTEAVASFGPGAEGTIVVHQADYNEAVTVDGGRVLALLANAGDTPIWLLAGGGAPQLTVDDGTVLLDGLRLSGNADDVGLSVDAGRAWVDRSRIVQNSGGGIVAQNAAELTLRNCFVGDGTNGENALTVDGTTSMASAMVSYTTLGTGFDNFNDVFPVFCDGAADVTIRNSLLVSFDNPSELSCSTATVTNTASEALIPGAGNVALGDVGMDWFVGVDNGDFHLNNPPGMLATTARWTTGDPPTDIDGNLRPTMDDAADYAGADVP